MPERRLAQVGGAIVIVLALGCDGKSSPAPRSAERDDQGVSAFSPPATIGACPPERLSVLEVPVDLGAPYKAYEWLPLEYALDHHSYASDTVIVLLVPEVDFEENVTAIRALRFDAGAGQWLAEARRELALPRGLKPRYADVTSGAVGADYVVLWPERFTNVKHGLVFSIGGGAFRDASASEIRAVPPFDGRSRDAGSPPDPEPLSLVSVAPDYLGMKATFSRRSAALGTVRFPSIPGAYIGAFGNTRTAFFWAQETQEKESDQANLRQLAAKRRQTYLVGLETGNACRLERELAYPATAVFRRPSFIAFVNALRTEARRSDCPPGAPCVAPEQSHFRGASLVVFRDRL